MDISEWLSEAAKCRRHAGRAASDKERRAWLEIARGWSVLAAENPSFAAANDLLDLDDER